MEARYSFLRDELALMEIRKHKWLESEKSGQEVGFATAAVDWVHKYGELWKQHRFGKNSESATFVEKRAHRRFSRLLPVKFKLLGQEFSSHTHDISLVGLSCTLPAALPSGTSTEVAIEFSKAGTALQTPMRFKSRISRITRAGGHTGYKIFVPFSEDVRDFLRANADALNN